MYSKMLLLCITSCYHVKQDVIMYNKMCITSNKMFIMYNKMFITYNKMFITYNKMLSCLLSGTSMCFMQKGTHENGVKRCIYDVFHQKWGSQTRLKRGTRR